MLEHGIKENAEVGLHDCRTGRIRADERTVSFFIPGGFYFISSRDTAATENCNAEVKCHLINSDPESFSVFIYRRDLFGRTVREDWSDRFVAAVNAGRFEFEFVYTYRSYHSILFKGYIWRNRRPWWRECEIELHTDEITYSWTDR